MNNNHPTRTGTVSLLQYYTWT